MVKYRHNRTRIPADRSDFTPKGGIGMSILEALVALVALLIIVVLVLIVLVGIKK